jgi:hypothetical protein
MVVDDTSLCFINVHLAAGQSQRAARNADLGGIMEDKAIFPAAEELPFVNGGDGTAILDHELVVLNGDLNVGLSSFLPALIALGPLTIYVVPDRSASRGGFVQYPS